MLKLSSKITPYIDILTLNITVCRDKVFKDGLGQKDRALMNENGALMKERPRPLSSLSSLLPFKDAVRKQLLIPEIQPHYKPNL